MRSNLPNAEQFQDWVCDEVLPSIRKHGIFATSDFIEEALNNPDAMIAALTKLKQERSARIEAEKQVAVLTHVNKTYTCTEVAKELGLKSAIELNKPIYILFWNIYHISTTNSIAMWVKHLFA